MNSICLKSCNSYVIKVIVSETDFLGNILNQVQQNFKKILKDYRVLNNYNEEEMFVPIFVLSIFKNEYKKIS